jgi:SAM-dependent methyltransferase
MTRESSSIELEAWLQTAPGRYLLDWEQQRFDEAVSDAFGYHALQLGLAELDALRCNRMPHRWVACDSLHVPARTAMPPPAAGATAAPQATGPVSLHCEFDALPFPNASVDMVLLPHALELARDPHQTLSEVERVLVPEGRVVIAGFNPASLWGLRQRSGRMLRGLGLARGRSLYLPRAGEFIGYWRLRDWLRLLSFEVEGGQFGCWRPPLRSERWLQRTAWMDDVGDRWWPVLGSVYFMVAVKRVRGMRLVGLLKPDKRKALAAAPAVATRRGGSAAAPVTAVATVARTAPAPRVQASEAES